MKVVPAAVVLAIAQNDRTAVCYSHVALGRPNSKDVGNCFTCHVVCNGAAASYTLKVVADVNCLCRAAHFFLGDGCGSVLQRR